MMGCVVQVAQLCNEVFDSSQLSDYSLGQFFHISSSSVQVCDVSLSFTVSTCTIDWIYRGTQSILH